MLPKRTETILSQSIQAAIANPDRADLRRLLDELEKLIDDLPQAKQLEVAGHLLCQIAEIYRVRANQFLEAWEEHHNPTLEEPVLTAQMLQEVLRHTMTLDLEELVEPRPNYHRNSYSTSEEIEDSIAAIVEKSDVLEFLDAVAEEEALQKAIAVSHSENISSWTEAIAQWMQECSCHTVSLVELQRSLQMPLVTLWLGILLSEYSIEQRGEFYQIETVWVSKPDGQQIATEP